MFEGCWDLVDALPRGLQLWHLLELWLVATQVEAHLDALLEKKHYFFDIWEKWGRHIWEKGVLGFFTSSISASVSALGGASPLTT